MKLKTVFLAAMACAAMLVAAPVGASANLIWCVNDPPLRVVTPGGNTAVVNTMLYLTREARHFKYHEITQSAVAQPDGHGGTLITVRVYLPEGVSAHVVSWDYRYQVWSEGDNDGDGDDAVTLILDVPIT